MIKIINMYKLIVFDLDDTLSLAKTKTDSEMAWLLKQLLEKYKVAIITWSLFKQIDIQIIKQLDNNSNFNNLFAFPTTWTSMYYYENNIYKNKYSENLPEEDIENIIWVLNNAIEVLKLTPKQVWGELIENRWSQITYSALWQKAPIEKKHNWDSDKKKRLKIKKYIEKDLIDYNIWIWGTTSIDITKKWIDKAYWMYKIIKNLEIEKEDILFVWDSIFEWWNDYPVITTWVDYKRVFDYNETKDIIRKLIKNDE